MRLSTRKTPRLTRARTLAAALGTLGLAGSSFGYVLADFETGIQGFNPAPSGPAHTTTVNAVGTVAGDTGAATTPTHYLDVNMPQGAFWGQRSRNLVADPLDRAAMIANTTLEFDMTLTGVALSGGNPSFAGFAQSNELAVTMFAPDGGDANPDPDINAFIQRNFTAGGGTDSLGQGAGWNGVDGTRHITWNLNNFTFDDPTTPPGDLKTVSQLLSDHPEIVELTIWNTAQAGNDPNAGNADFFFDTYTVTPEPGSLSLAALIVPSLLRRRR